ncbi:glutamine synthetase [Thermanaerothrix daxensis]|uniref:glutamine synthetase n=1 Tax=Thermanaerothrix daxensis TaxID=869279 RepID=A0A0N8GQB9_9CHLR|nr:type I glutamate--ammonia ligase [Thermanaerothrix daxensis]KPL83266.1 glutamine synthetase [Thermanaerothrix daxensis]
MFKNFTEAQTYITEHHIRQVDLKFCDLWGAWHHVTITAREFTPGLFARGVGFDGSSVGFKSVRAGDMVLIPDLGTAFLDPFWEIPTLSFICDIYEADTREPFSRDPRGIARRAEIYLCQTGIADQSIWGPEFEFYVFSNVQFENGVNTACYRLDSIESAWKSGTGGHGHYIALHEGYHAIPPKDQLYNLRAEMVDHLEALGLPVKYHHHEVGGPGQCEIETPLMEFLPAADAALILKYVTKMTALRMGLSVTFLPKPLYGEAGNGMHFHQLLRLKGQNVFYDPDAPYHLSPIARYYIGGLLFHAPALLAFTNPTTNSYRRLVPGFEAPVNCFFSSGNRSAAIRIPKYATEPESFRFEFRPPDATCNPYLAMAAMLMAGIDGIRQQIDPSAHGFGPIDDDIFSWPPERRKSIKSLPTSLGEALQALEADHDFLLAGGVFTPDLIQDWIRRKSAEEAQVRLRPHPYEIELYYSV